MVFSGKTKWRWAHRAPINWRDQVLELASGPAVDYPRAACVHELVEAQVDRTPDATALVDDLGPVTYRQLDARANRLAHALCRAGAGCGSRVAIFLHRGAAWPQAMLAALKVGAAYVPLDPREPAPRLQSILQQTDPAVIVTQRSLEEALPAGEADVLRVDADRDRIDRESPSRPAIAADAGHPAYVIFNSGSTGEPEGVVIRTALTNHMSWMQRVFPLAPADAVLQKTPATFDASVWEFYAPSSPARGW